MEVKRQSRMYRERSAEETVRTLLTIFMTLKLAGVVAWPWWQVLSPWWMWWAGVLLYLTVRSGYRWFKDKRKEQAQ